MSYAKEFLGSLTENIQAITYRLDTNDKGNLVRTKRNTTLFAKALHDTFSKMNDVAGMIGMTMACDYSELEEQ